jgi:two-component system sensor histidine kinase MprB
VIIGGGGQRRRPHRAPGSGLGLAVVRAIAQSHDGEVFAEPRPGGGAAIGFTLHA